MTCGRCGTRVPPGQEERCWWDFAALCGDCWETYGHCGHADIERKMFMNMADEVKKIVSDKSNIPTNALGQFEMLKKIQDTLKKLGFPVEPKYKRPFSARL